MIVHPSKETHFSRFYNTFPSFVCMLCLTACLLLARCASRGMSVAKRALLFIAPPFLHPGQARRAEGSGIWGLLPHKGR